MSFEKFNKKVRATTLGITSTIATITPVFGGENDKNKIKEPEISIEVSEKSEFEKENKFILEKLIDLENTLKKNADKVVHDNIRTYAFLPERELLKVYRPEISEVEHLVNFDVAHNFANSPKNGVEYNINIREQTHLRALSKDFALVKKPKHQNDNIELKRFIPVDTYIIIGIRDNSLIVRLINPKTKEISVHEYDLNTPEIVKEINIEKKQQLISKLAEQKIQELIR